MIPVIEDWVTSCDTGDVLAEVGFLAGMIIAGTGVYKYITDTLAQRPNETGLLMTATGGTFMIASYAPHMLLEDKCLYRYKE